MESKDSAYSNLWNTLERLIHQAFFLVLSIQRCFLFGMGGEKGSGRGFEHEGGHLIFILFFWSRFLSRRSKVNKRGYGDLYCRTRGY